MKKSPPQLKAVKLAESKARKLVIKINDDGSIANISGIGKQAIQNASVLKTAQNPVPKITDFLPATNSLSQFARNIVLQGRNSKGLIGNSLLTDDKLFKQMNFLSAITGPNFGILEDCNLKCNLKLD